jgi:hypothetical protein
MRWMSRYLSPIALPNAEIYQDEDPIGSGEFDRSRPAGITVRIRKSTLWFGRYSSICCADAERRVV